MAIIESDAVDAKLAKGHVHRFNPMFLRAYDDRRRTPHPNALAKLQRYDRNLFLRFNLVLGLWELWRWKGSVIPRTVQGLPPEEYMNRAVFLFKSCHPTTGEALPPDDRLFRRVILADQWAVGNYTPDQVERSLASEEALIERRRIAANEQFADDWAADNKHQIRSRLGTQRVISTPR